MNGQNRADVKVGTTIKIVLKADQRTGKLTDGVVVRLLTNRSFHPHGVKVMLEDGGLLQMDKRFVALKQAQKEKINGWMYDAYRGCCLRIGKDPGRERNANIIGAAFQKIEAVEIWIPYGEIVRYYNGRKTAFRRRFLHEMDADWKPGNCSQDDQGDSSL